MKGKKRICSMQLHLPSGRSIRIIEPSAYFAEYGFSPRKCRAVLCYHHTASSLTKPVSEVRVG